MKSEWYREALSCVLRHTEVEEENLLRSNREECVDARSLLVHALYKIGFTDTEVASMMGLTRPCVNKLRSSHEYRVHKRMYSILWKQISNELNLN